MTQPWRKKQHPRSKQCRQKTYRLIYGIFIANIYSPQKRKGKKKGRGKKHCASESSLILLLDIFQSIWVPSELQLKRFAHESISTRSRWILSTCSLSNIPSHVANLAFDSLLCCSSLVKCLNVTQLWSSETSITCNRVHCGIAGRGAAPLPSVLERQCVLELVVTSQDNHTFATETQIHENNSGLKTKSQIKKKILYTQKRPPRIQEDLFWKYQSSKTEQRSQLTRGQIHSCWRTKSSTGVDVKSRLILKVNCSICTCLRRS